MGDFAFLAHLSRTETKIVFTLISRWESLCDNVKNLRKMKILLDEQFANQYVSDETWEKISGGLQVSGSAMKLASWGLTFAQAFGYMSFIPKGTDNVLMWTGGGLKTSATISEMLRSSWRHQWRKDLSDFLDELRSLEKNVTGFNSLRRELGSILRKKTGSNEEIGIKSFLKCHMSTEDGHHPDDDWISDVIFGEAPICQNNYKQATEPTEDVSLLFKRISDLRTGFTFGESLRGDDWSYKTALRGILEVGGEIFDLFEGMDKLGYKTEVFQKMKGNVNTFKLLSNVLMIMIDMDVKEITKKFDKIFEKKHPKKQCIC